MKRIKVILIILTIWSLVVQVSLAKRIKQPLINVAIGLKLGRCVIKARSGVVIKAGKKKYYSRKPLKISYFAPYINVDGIGKFLKFKVYPIKKREYLRFNGRRYRGIFIVRQDINGGGFVVINRLKIEDYLKGVIKREMLISAGLEALLAQAVVARSFAYSYYLNSKHPGAGFHLCATTHCQVYGGREDEDIKCTKAVRATHGIVAFYKKMPAKLFYTSCCGGHTVNNEDAWGGKPIPYLRGRVCNFCRFSRQFSYEFVIDIDQLNEYFIDKTGYVKDLKIESVAPSGRVKEILIVGERKNLKITGKEFRKLIGYTRIKSLKFKIYKKKRVLTLKELIKKIKKRRAKVKSIKDIITLSILRRHALNKRKDKEIKFYIRGEGYGHGVGMCQAGARIMAERNFDYRRILHYYYKGIRLVKLW